LIVTRSKIKEILYLNSQEGIPLDQLFNQIERLGIMLITAMLVRGRIAT